MIHIVVKTRKDNLYRAIYVLIDVLGNNWKVGIDGDYAWITAGPLTYGQHIDLINECYTSDSIIDYKVVNDE